MRPPPLTDPEDHKPLRWVGSSRDDVRELPAEVCDRLGFALRQAQAGVTPDSAKPLHGLGRAGVWELVEDHDTNTYRGVYAVCFAEAVYVLHVFQKKSKRGSETPRHDMALIRARLHEAEEDHARRTTSAEVLTPRHSRKRSRASQPPRR